MLTEFIGGTFPDIELPGPIAWVPPAGTDIITIEDLGGAGGGRSWTLLRRGGNSSYVGTAQGFVFKSGGRSKGARYGGRGQESERGPGAGAATKAFLGAAVAGGSDTKGG